jgi:hypothetical protein
MADELMDGYPDIYDQLVDTDPLALRDRARRLEWWLRQLGATIAADDIHEDTRGEPSWGWFSTADSVSITRTEAAELADLLGLEGGPR